MILLTGGSGQLSSLIAQRARAAALDIRIGSRRADETDESRRRVDFDDPHTLDFRGIDTLMMISAGYAEDDVVIRRHDAVIAAAIQSGVRHVVYTSLSGSGDHLAFALAHRWTEKRLKGSVLHWTILRNGLYAELIGALAAPVDGEIRAPFGTAPISPVAREDLADAAMEVLKAPAAHAGRTYELSGVKAWSVADLAEALGASYRPSSLEAARASLANAPLKPFQPPMLMSIYSSAAAGFLQTPSTDLPALLLAPPRETLAIAAAAAGASG
ncbi:NAD(P)H-binding protein [Peteryoungia ipomoeae]|uniref:NmrA family transcriptional regulator n=1 Tax=Peteryoungia ipomoeae TaxID=1210932 RepID=A0A4S8P7S9_9HYPH|nr:NAD(P)H-binding protein [Peteryoungia ipomoeae]THV24044.1 NmrA family transcriptional regulator [Peteryoungia ipomoeae]